MEHSNVFAQHSSVLLLVCTEVHAIVLHYGVTELMNAGSTDATLAVRKACMQKSRLCREDVSNSYRDKAQNKLVNFTYTGGQSLFQALL
jgi:hypothetical protein